MVPPGHNRFGCPKCGTVMALPPENKPSHQLQQSLCTCISCKTILGVPPGVVEFGCPSCGARMRANNANAIGTNGNIEHDQMHSLHEREDQIREIFATYDTSGDMLIDRAELSLLLKDLQFPKVFTNQQFMAADYNRDGVLSFEEFVPLYNRLRMVMAESAKTATVSSEKAALDEERAKFEAERRAFQDAQNQNNQLRQEMQEQRKRSERLQERLNDIEEDMQGAPSASEALQFQKKIHEEHARETNLRATEYDSAQAAQRKKLEKRLAAKKRKKKKS